MLIDCYPIACNPLWEIGSIEVGCTQTCLNIRSQFTDFGTTPKQQQLQQQHFCKKSYSQFDKCMGVHVLDVVRMYVVALRICAMFEAFSTNT